MKKKKTEQGFPPHAKLAFKGERFNVYQWDQKLFDGSTAVFEKVARVDSATIIPLVDNQVVILKEKHAHWLYEHFTIPGGQIEEGEDIFEAARRETEEETGMAFKNYYLVESERRVFDLVYNHYMFIATDYVGNIGQHLDPGEQVRAMKVSLPKFIDMVKKRVFYHKPVFIDEFLIRGEEKKLKEIFKNPKKYQIKLPAF